MTGLTHGFCVDRDSGRGMPPVRRPVVDVLKPHDPPLLGFTEQVAGTESVPGVTSSLIELDQAVKNLKLTLESEDVDSEAAEATVESLGGTVHSVDQVACGESAVGDRPTLQTP